VWPGRKIAGFHLKCIEMIKDGVRSRSLCRKRMTVVEIDGAETKRMEF
jgi:hypothetical protein